VAESLFFIQANRLRHAIMKSISLSVAGCMTLNSERLDKPLLKWLWLAIRIFSAIDFSQSDIHEPVSHF